jgi:organic radical activating enzyme
MGASQGYLSEVFVSFQGEGAHVGERHLFVRLAGCNLRCRYCDTPDSLERTSGYQVHEVADITECENPVSGQQLSALLADTILHRAPIDAVAVTGGEPLLQSEFVADLLGVRDLSVPILLETSGILHRRLKDVLPYVHIISMDIKTPSNTGERPFWSDHREFLKLASVKEVYVKILVDCRTSDDDLNSAVDVVSSVDSGIPTFLQPIVDEQGYLMVDYGHLEHAYALVRERLTRVRVFPQVHKMLGIR